MSSDTYNIESVASRILVASRKNMEQGYFANSITQAQATNLATEILENIDDAKAAIKYKATPDAEECWRHIIDTQIKDVAIGIKVATHNELTFSYMAIMFEAMRQRMG